MFELCDSLRYVRMELGMAGGSASIGGAGRQNARIVRGYLRNAFGVLHALLADKGLPAERERLTRLAVRIEGLVFVAGRRRNGWHDEVVLGVRYAIEELLAIAVDIECPWALAQEEAGLISAAVERHKEVA